jgi:hypothetical protein
MLRRCRSHPRIIDGLSHDSAAVLPLMGQCGRYLFGQDWIHEPRTAPADFAFIAPRPLAAAKSLLHLATQAAFLFSTPFWASAGVLTASIQVAATKAAPATISFIADALYLAGPILAGPLRRPATPKMGGLTSAEQHRQRPTLDGNDAVPARCAVARGARGYLPPTPPLVLRNRV